MEELRIICEINTRSPDDTRRVLKVLENQDVLVRRLDMGSGRDQFIVMEKVNDCSNNY